MVVILLALLPAAQLAFPYTSCSLLRRNAAGGRSSRFPALQLVCVPSNGRRRLNPNPSGQLHIRFSDRPCALVVGELEDGVFAATNDVGLLS